MYSLSTGSQSGTQVVKVRLRDLVRVGQDHLSLREMVAIPFNLDMAHLVAQGFAEILPKLRNLASAFARYRVTSARLHWQPLCSALSATSVGFAIAPGLCAAPGGAVSLVSYAASAVGPSWTPMQTSVWRNMESRWFHLRHSDQAYLETGQALEEIVPFTILYGTVGGYPASSGTDNTGLADGLLWLDLAIEFCDMAPPPPLSLSLEAGTSRSMNSANRFFSWKTLNNMIGWFDWAADAYRSYTTDGVTATPVPPGVGWNVEPASCIEWFGDFPLAAASTSAEVKGQGDFEVLRRPGDRYKCLGTCPDPRERQISRRRRGPRDAPTGYAPGVVGVYVASTDDGVPFDPDSPRRRSTVGAAGDVTVYLLFQPSRTGAVMVTVYSVGFTPGTGAIELMTQWSGAVTEPGTFFVQIVPTGAETRVVSDTASMSYDVVAKVTSH